MVQESREIIETTIISNPSYAIKAQPLSIRPWLLFTLSLFQRKKIRRLALTPGSMAKSSDSFQILA